MSKRINFLALAIVSVFSIAAFATPGQHANVDKKAHHHHKGISSKALKLANDYTAALNADQQPWTGAKEHITLLPTACSEKTVSTKSAKHHKKHRHRKNEKGHSHDTASETAVQPSSSAPVSPSSSTTHDSDPAK